MGKYLETTCDRMCCLPTRYPSSPWFLPKEPPFTFYWQYSQKGEKKRNKAKRRKKEGEKKEHKIYLHHFSDSIPEYDIVWSMI